MPEKIRMTRLAERLIREWCANGERWEIAARKARRVGLNVWNPALYALDLYRSYLTRFPPQTGAILALGLNPGPYGMAQTGIPFTDCRTAKGTLGLMVDIPGKAPPSLVERLKKENGRWRGTYERSSLGIYRFLHLAWGDIQTATGHWFVGNPCPLLFLDPQGWNVTPADSRLARIPDFVELRRTAVIRFAHILRPRGIVCLGGDVVKAVGSVSESLVGRQNVVAYSHPARAVPHKWAEGLVLELSKRNLLAPRKEL